VVRSTCDNERSKTNFVAVSDELVAKLQSEISMEEDMKEDDDLSTNIKEYLENSPFEVRILSYPISTIEIPHSQPSRSRTRPATRKSS
jgi:hypothetical protein